MKDAFRGNDIIKILTKGTIERKVSEKVVLMILSPLGDNLLRPTQECKTAKEARNKFQKRCIRRTIGNTLGLPKTILNKTLEIGTNIQDHVANLIFQCSQFVSVGTVIEHTIKVAIFISTITNFGAYGRTISSVNNVQEKTAAWSRRIPVYLEENASLSGRADPYSSTCKQHGG